MYEETKVDHPHGNHMKAGHGEGKVHVKDPGGFTVSNTTGGSIPGGTEGGKTHTKVSKGTV